MNTPNRHLWELIHSMTPAEKRYYKTHFASDTSLHTILFDQLNEQNSFSEETIKKNLTISASVFKVLKAQLYEIIIKSLIAQKGKRNLKSTIRLGLEEVDLLLEREHYTTATKKLKKLAKKCSQYGLTLYQYEITERLHEIQHLELDFSEPNALKYYEELVNYQAILAQKRALSGVQLKIEAWTHFMPMRHEAIKQLVTQLFEMKAEFLDFSNFLIWYQSLASCYELQSKEEDALNIRQQILSLFENNKRFQRELPLSYLNALKQATSINLTTPNLKYINSLSIRAEKTIAIFPQYSPHYIYFLWAKLQAYYLHHRWQPIIKNLDNNCMHYILNYQLEGIKTTAKIVVILATTHLINGHYKRAKELLETFTNLKTKKEKVLIYCVNILKLILSWETEDLEFLMRKVLHYKRQLKSNKDIRFSNIYTIHLDLFTDIARDPYLLPPKASETLLRISEDPLDPLLYYYSLFNLERWIQAAAVRKQWHETFVPSEKI